VPIAVVVAVTLVSGIVGGVVGRGLASGEDEHGPSRSASRAPATTPSAGSAGAGATAPLDVKAILAKVGPSVVDVIAYSSHGTDDGSGIIINADGDVLTNAHNVVDSTRITVTLPGRKEALPANLVGADERHDVALLHVDPGAARSSEGETGVGFTPAELGRSADVKVGDDVVAIGNALGLRGDPTVTHGIVSALNRTFDDLTGMIQTDAAINPGNSGGPLVNMSGQVIGINTAGAGEEAQSINFAIPIDAAQAVADRLKSGQGPVPAAFLGVSTAESSDGAPGARITDVVRGGPAAQAGLVAGDRIVTFDGKPVESPEAFYELIQARQPGDTVEVVVDRGGSSRTVNVRLGTRSGR
jgi:putative serine protease PepD